MSALIGLQVRLRDNCKCGADTAVVGDGNGKFAATLACPQCGSSRGAISEFTLHCVESMAARFGAPAAITIRSSAIAKACAKQDEFLKRKYTPTGKSWFDVITDNFAENALRQAALARSRIHPLVPKISQQKEKPMTDTTETANLPAIPDSSIAAINNYLAQEDPQTTIGKLIKFSKGEFLKGLDADVVPLGSLFTIACDMTLTGFIRWHDGKPVEPKLIRIASGDPPYRREDLGFLDKEQWPKDSNGEPRDPWQPTIYVPVMDSVGEIATFTCGSVSGIKSYHRLLRRYTTHAARHPGDYPLVKLQASFFKHSDKQIGKVFYPDFEPAGYVERTEFVEALEAMGVAVDTSPPAALPAPKDEMNDAIPF